MAGRKIKIEHFNSGPCRVTRVSIKGVARFELSRERGERKFFVVHYYIGGCQIGYVFPASGGSHPRLRDTVAEIMVMRFMGAP